MQFAHHESAITLTAKSTQALGHVPRDGQLFMNHDTFWGHTEKRVQLKLQCELIIFSQSTSGVDLLISWRLITRAS